jgi:hypothetical protein
MLQIITLSIVTVIVGVLFLTYGRGNFVPSCVGSALTSALAMGAISPLQSDLITNPFGFFLVMAFYLVLLYVMFRRFGPRFVGVDLSVDNPSTLLPKRTATAFNTGHTRPAQPTGSQQAPTSAAARGYKRVSSN